MLAGPHPDQAPPGDTYYNSVSFLHHASDGGTPPVSFNERSSWAASVTASGGVWSATSKFSPRSFDLNPTVNTDATQHIRVNSPETGTLAKTKRFDFANGTVDFTLEGWFRIEDIPLLTGGSDYDGCLFSTYNSAGGAGWFVTIYSSTGSSIDGVYVWDGTTGHDFPSGNTFGALPLNSWLHIAVVMENPVVRVYVNGVQIGPVDGTGVYGYAMTGAWYDDTTVSGHGLRVGALNSTAPLGFRGKVDEVRVTKGVARYTSSVLFPSPTSPSFIVPNTPFPKTV